MGKEQAHHVGDRKALVSACLLALVAGLVAVTVGCYGWSSQNLINVDKLVRFNLGITSGFVLTVRTCMMILIVMGVVAVLSAAAGALGAQKQNKCLTSQYLAVAAVLGTTMLFLGVHALNRQSEVTSVVQSQMQALCSKDDYQRITENLGCPGVLQNGQSPVACNDVCQSRVDSLRPLDPCDFLPRVCREFVYSADLVPTGQNGAFYTAPAGTAKTHADCQAVCNQDITCKGYEFGSVCTVESDNKQRYMAESYTQQPSSFQAKSPQLKGNPIMLESFKKHGKRLACVILLLAVIMLGSALISWRVLYNQILDKDNKPSAGHICRMLCCCPVDTREYRTSLEEEGLME